MELPSLGGEGVAELYDAERLAIINVRTDMLRKHSFRGVTTVREEDEIKRRFTEEMRGRCAELGFEVEVEWNWESEERDAEGIPLHQSPCVSSSSADGNLYWLPRVVFVGRMEKMGEFDHDKQRDQVISGLLDGKAGYIREDGTFREDPKRKNYY